MTHSNQRGAESRYQLTREAADPAYSTRARAGMVPEIAARTYLDPDGLRGVPAGAALPHGITHAALTSNSAVSVVTDSSAA
ncbi:hypothetical protein [Streptomyces aurantiogriseus]|uniref:Uncharacterized protein n=1 Tax=Streptomyces aurantiogriseus TaxID=66870 RepID=A0A918KZV2_9ACTN|nr:hypothetical protein [Streptomyces aurantiogriseus]GGR56201.1 hypothetical protein GCM10010251_86500 [Streptomyces aurantiogriseus]